MKTYKEAQKSNLQHTGAWSDPTRRPRRLCFRPLAVFRHLRPTAISFPQINIRHISGTLFLQFYTFFKIVLSPKFRKVKLPKSGSVWTRRLWETSRFNLIYGLWCLNFWCENYTTGTKGHRLMFQLQELWRCYITLSKSTFFDFVV